MNGNLSNIFGWQISERREGKMKFSDLFLPKIARSNPEVRKKAVLEEKNKELLMKVIQNDSDRDVRQTARKRLQRLNT
jgi:hypothetical protein